MVILLRQIALWLLFCGVLTACALLAGRTMRTESEIGYQVWDVRAYTHYVRDLGRGLRMNLGGTRCFDMLPDAASQYRGVEVWLDQVYYAQIQEAVTTLRC